jgi:hypothetical protein
VRGRDGLLLRDRNRGVAAFAGSSQVSTVAPAVEKLQVFDRVLQQDALPSAGSPSFMCPSVTIHLGEATVRFKLPRNPQTMRLLPQPQIPVVEQAIDKRGETSSRGLLGRSKPGERRSNRLLQSMSRFFKFFLEALAGFLHERIEKAS